MIHRLLSAGGILILSAPLALAQTSTLVPDKAHSEVDFSVVHLSLFPCLGIASARFALQMGLRGIAQSASGIGRHPAWS